MKNRSLKFKMLSIVALFAVGGLVYGYSVNMSMTEKLENSDYRSVMAMRDLIADILPPPMYVIEAYSVALEMPRSKTDAELRDLIQRFGELEKERGERETFWTQNAEELGVGKMLPMIKDPAAATAREFFRIGNEQLVPAFAAGNREAGLAALEHASAAYYRHRKAIDELVAESIKETGAAESRAAATIASRKMSLTLLGLAVILVGAGATIVLAQSIARRANALGDILGEVAEGDLRPRASVDSTDELGVMSSQLNSTLDAVEGSFRQVRNVARSLAETAPSLAASSDEISSGAQQQAASLEETAASLEEITAAVKQSASNAQQASDLALGSRDVAERGGHVVGEAVAAMNEIRVSSRRIADIITTIDEVALQTNLLALNAAVEAARAGELGRGFAVVAAEVGNLAQRSASAAKEVKSLIQDSLQRVEAGHELVDQSGKSLEAIILSVKKVTDVVGEIAAASREQSVGIDQVNQAVSQMDQVTQSNASQTQELTRTADVLSETSAELRALVDKFNLSGQDSQERTARGGGTGRRKPALHHVTQRQATPHNDNHEAVDVYSPTGTDFEVM